MPFDPMTYDCLVLSGGGAKGAYGAGASKAWFAYRRLKSIDTSVCFVGTSAGALNACLLAAHGVDALEKLWSDLAPRDVFGWWPHGPVWRLVLGCVSPIKVFRAIGRLFGFPLPYSLYSGKALQKTITAALANLDFSKFEQSAHLILAVTNYTKGEMGAFYVSSFLDRYKEIDQRRDVSEQRLSHLKRIDSRDMLIKALLASSAIPVAFPPVEIGGDLYIDGGVGNNTPTREAAQFLRFLNEYPAAPPVKPGDVFCVVQDPPGTVLESAHSFGLFEIAWRVYELFHYTQMRPVIRSWHQISGSAREHRRKATEFSAILDTIPMPADAREKTKEEFERLFGRLRGATERLDLPLHEVAPSGTLGSFLKFGAKAFQSGFEQGYTDMVQMLESKGFIVAQEREVLLGRIRDRVKV